MKRNDIKALHDKSLAELQAQLRDLQKQLNQAKLEAAVDKLEDVNVPAKLRDDIARIKTVLRNKQLLAEAEQKQQAQAAEAKEDKNNKDQAE